MTEDWIPITAKFHSACLECMGDIEAGDSILWLKGKGTKHRECPEVIEKTHEIEMEEDYSKWYNIRSYSYGETQLVKQCQKCGQEIKKDKFIISDISGCRAVCETCFG